MTTRELFTLVRSARLEDVQAHRRRSQSRSVIERACPICHRRAAIQKDGVCRWQRLHAKETA